MKDINKGVIWQTNFLGKSGLAKVVKISKENSEKTYIFSDDNNSNIGWFYLKNGKFAKRTSENPNYDFQNNKTILIAKVDVIYKFREFPTKFNKGGSTYAEGGRLKEDWKKYVLENSSWFENETEEESNNNQINLRTRENGDVGYEEVGQEDINEAKNIIKKVVAKFPKTQYEIEEVDEWVHLNLMPNKTEEQLNEEKIKNKKQKAKKQSAKLIAKESNITEEKALKIIEDFSYAKEYYDKNKDFKPTYNNAFRVYYSNESPTIKFENAQQVFDFITKDDFIEDVYYSAKPRNKVIISLYGWDSLTIKYDNDARPILPNGRMDWSRKGKVLNVYPFFLGNIETKENFIQKLTKSISDFIIAYKIYVLKEKGTTYAEGGEIKIQEIFPKDNLLDLLKSIKFKSFDSSKISEIEYTSKTYNPFDKNFVAEIEAYPCVIEISKIKGLFQVRLAKMTGGIIQYGSCEYIFDIEKLTFKEFEKGLQKVVKNRPVALYSKFGTGNIDNFYFFGNLKGAKKFAKANGYEEEVSDGREGLYFLKESMVKHKNERILNVGTFTQRQIESTGIKTLGEGKSTYAEGGEVYNAHILTNDNKLIHRRYTKKITQKEIYKEYKDKGVEIKDSQIHFAKPIDFFDKLREQTKKYVRENMNDDVDSENIFISSMQKGNEYIATEIKGDTISGKAFTITPKDLFKAEKIMKYKDGGLTDTEVENFNGTLAIDSIDDLLKPFKRYGIKVKSAPLSFNRISYITVNPFLVKPLIGLTEIKNYLKQFDINTSIKKDPPKQVLAQTWLQIDNNQIIDMYNYKQKNNKIGSKMKKGGSTYAEGGRLKNMETQRIEILGKIAESIGIDEAIELQEKDYVIHPFVLIGASVRKGFIKTNKITKELIESAIEESDDIDNTYRDSGDGIGSSDMNYFVKNMLDGANVKYAIGGEVTYTDTNSYASRRGKGGVRIWENYKNIINQKAVGSFSHIYNKRNVGDYYLFLLDDYDRKFYSHIPLKPNEMLFRNETDKGKISKSLPLIKINIKNGRVYFMSDANDPNSDEDDKNPKFNRASANVDYLSLDDRVKKYNDGIITYDKLMEDVDKTYAKGGIMTKEKNEQVGNVKVGDYVEFKTFRDGNRKGLIVRNIDSDNWEIGHDKGVSLIKKEKVIGVTKPKKSFWFEHGGNLSHHKLATGGDTQVAQTIATQLGGTSRLKMMVGAHNFATDGKNLVFKIKNPKINYIKITLNGKDLYDLEFSKVGISYKVVKEYKDIYNDQLVELFEKTTGMYLSFEKGGGIQKANAGAYLMAAKEVKNIAPNAVDALDKKIANKVAKKSFIERMSETGNEDIDNKRDYFNKTEEIQTEEIEPKTNQNDKERLMQLASKYGFNK